MTCPMIGLAFPSVAMHGQAFRRGNSFFTSFRRCFHQLHSPVRPRVHIRTPQTPPTGASRRGFASSSCARATHHNYPVSPLLSQALDQRSQVVRDTQVDTAGPFMLGTIDRSGPKDKEWSELSTKGKVIRSSKRTSNFVVIAVGAGLTVVLVYALLSELFARNSPTVKFNEASKLIEQSEEVREYLPGKLVFHNNPPSALRPKHRNRRVSSRLMQDSSGREHLLLNFYVRADRQSTSHDGFFQRAVNIVKRIGEKTWTWEEFRDWMSEKARNTRDNARRLFHYLTGDTYSGRMGPPYPFGTGTEHSSGSASPSTNRETHIGRNTEESRGVWGAITGLFSGIGKGMTGATSIRHTGAEEHIETFEEGEVHCDLVKNENGDYVWRYILVDMPYTRARYPKRVFVRRTPDVRDYEAVLRWS